MRRHREMHAAKADIGLDAELVVEIMVLAGVGSPQDAVEPVVRTASRAATAPRPVRD